MKKVSWEQIKARRVAGAFEIEDIANKCGVSKQVKTSLINGFRDGFNDAIKWLESQGVIEIEGLASGFQVPRKHRRNRR